MASPKKTSSPSTKGKGKAPAANKQAGGKAQAAAVASAVKSKKKETRAATERKKGAVPSKEMRPAKKVVQEKGVTTENRMQQLKRNLIKKRDTLIKETKEELSKHMSGETRQLVDTAVDEGDWAVVDITEDISLRRLGSHRKKLLEINEALRKIEEGSYGVCEECGEEIGERRLMVLPSAARCVECQDKKEKMESLEIEEL